MFDEKDMKVLISAFACQPNKGSEPTVGWNWAFQMSRYAEVSVLTREGNRESIEKWQRENKKQFEGRRLRFLYYAPSKMITRLVDRGKLPIQVMYILWQLGVYQKYKNKLSNYDILHHITYNTLMFPGMWWNSTTKVILGPLGGTSTVSKPYRPLYSSGKLKMRIRNFLILHWNKLPWVTKSMDCASLILCANSVTDDLLRSRYAHKMAKMLETGMDSSMDAPEPKMMDNPAVIKLAWLGVLETRKALSIALEAVALVVARLGEEVNIHLDVVGDGSLFETSKRSVDALGIGGFVTLHGRLPLSEAQMTISDCDIFLFTSVNDTSGNVVLEAMNYSKPVICIEHQGVKDITTDETAIRIPPQSIQGTIEGFADAIIKLINAPERRASMGKSGKKRLLEKYTWERKREAMWGMYQDLVR